MTRESGLSAVLRFPDHWPTSRFGALFTESSERKGRNEVGVPLSVSEYRGVTPRDALGGQMESEDVSLYRVVRPGQLAANVMWLNRSGLGISQHLGYVSPAYKVYSVSADLNLTFANYLLRSSAYRAWFEHLGRGVRPNAQMVDTADLRAIKIPVPPQSEQDAIADHLDRETARIDTLIEEQQRLVAMLRERRIAVAYRYFQGAADQRITTVKRVLRPLRRQAEAGQGVITAYRDGAVTLRSNRRDDGYTFSDLESGYQSIHPGDLVFHALDGFAGAVGVSDSRGNATPVYHVCEPIAGDDVTYLALLLRHLGLSGFLATQAPSTRQRSVDFRNWSTFGRVPLSLPSLTEQRRVVACVIHETARIDALIAESERFVELSRERRSALITAVVTGQIDVQGEVA